MASPRSGSSYSAPARLVLVASASDSDGRVTKVEFFSGSSLVGMGTLYNSEHDDDDHDSAGNLYYLTWSRVPVGSYTITAKATDDQGATTTSSPISVTVRRGNSRSDDSR
jgi:hypothetical protein